MINPLTLADLLVYDLFHPEIKHPWGVVAIAGEAGTGKTATMAHYGTILAPKLYPKVDLKVYSNFDLQGQAGAITCIGDILELPRDSICLIDEAPNWFDARKFASFPPEMMQPLTQHRHADIQLVLSTQVFNHMDARIRELCTMIVEVSTWANRLTTAHWYRRSEYELIAGKEDEFRHPKARRKYSFLQTPELRSVWDTKHEYIRAILKEQNRQYQLNN